MKRREFLIFGLAAMLPACAGGSGSGGVDYAGWGGQGLRDGSFVRPRAICADASTVYVIDVTGRIQVFNPEGKFLRGWSVPEHENGTPTGVTFAINGNLLVPDTHYSRILEYTRFGELKRSWGSYGTGDGQFIYPTGIAQDKAGKYYISEYGMEAEQVRVFDTNMGEAHKWGGHGAAAGRFNRAMAIAQNEAGVYVVDTANHRVQRFDEQGRLLTVIGSPGTEPGKLKFPHDISLGSDGSLWVCEYGSHRISRFSGTGEFMGTYGGPGRGPGQFNGPRGIAVSDTGMVFVTDTDNHRIQRFMMEPPA